jgi:hypothetical protein
MKMNIWKFNQLVTKRLLIWSVLSMVIGLILLISGSDFWKGFAWQALAWGAVDAAIALIGSAMTKRRFNLLPDPFAADVVLHESAKLKKLLLVNVVLDVLYVIGGILLAFTKGKTDAFWQGTGWGIVVQGAFLFAFDLHHALLIKLEAVTH